MSNNMNNSPFSNDEINRIKMLRYIWGNMPMHILIEYKEKQKLRQFKNRQKREKQKNERWMYFYKCAQKQLCVNCYDDDDIPLSQILNVIRRTKKLYSNSSPEIIQNDMNNVEPDSNDDLLVNFDDVPELNDDLLVNFDDVPELNNNSSANSTDVPELNNNSSANSTDVPELNINISINIKLENTNEDSWFNFDIES
jgi:hypothetical protein